MASALRYLSIPLLTAAVPAGFALWAFPEGLAPIRMVGIVIGWVGCGLLLVSLLLMLREPRLARWLGGLERMYRWHHRTGVVAYVLLLVHPLALAANGLSTSPAFAWETLSAFDEGWPVWSGWLGLLVLMLGLAARSADASPMASGAGCMPVWLSACCLAWSTLCCSASTNRFCRSLRWWR